MTAFSEDKKESGISGDVYICSERKLLMMQVCASTTADSDAHVINSSKMNRSVMFRYGNCRHTNKQKEGDTVRYCGKIEVDLYEEFFRKHPSYKEYLKK